MYLNYFKVDILKSSNAFNLNMRCTIKYPYSYNFDFVAIRMFLFLILNNVIKTVTKNVTR